MGYWLFPAVAMSYVVTDQHVRGETGEEEGEVDVVEGQALLERFGSWLPQVSGHAACRRRFRRVTTHVPPILALMLARPAERSLELDTRGHADEMHSMAVKEGRVCVRHENMHVLLLVTCQSYVDVVRCVWSPFCGRGIFRADDVESVC